MVRPILSCYRVAKRPFKRLSIGCASRNYSDGDSSKTDDSSTATAWVPPPPPPLQQQGSSTHKLNTGDKTAPDWLQTRRKVLGQPMDHHSRDNIIEVKHHTLLTKNEIATCIDALGGTNLTVILDDPKNRRMDGALGMIVCTARTAAQRSAIADALVRHMRRRMLQETGVIGAESGPEGDSESWCVVDCRNYVVHLMDERTRALVRLEDIWTGKDDLHHVNSQDEDAVEDYVAANPVPEDYNVYSDYVVDSFKQLERTSQTTLPRRAVGKSRRRTTRR